jgi:hypothetical protein
MKIKVGELKFDPELLYLRPIDVHGVSKYRQAMREGAKFPKIVVDSTNTIIAGNHRVTAYRQEFGDDYIIEAEKITFASPRERIEYFAKDNSVHGLPLAAIEKKRIASKLIGLGSSTESIASMFGVAVKRVEEWVGMTVCVIGNAGAPGTIVTREYLPLKQGSSHMAGEEVSKAEYAEHNESDLGLEDYVIADHLASRLRRGWVDFNDDKTAEALRNLRKEINRIAI